MRKYDGDYETDWPEVTFVPVAGLPAITIPAMKCCHGLEDDPWAYVGHEVLIFREVKRVLAPHGTLWLNLGDSWCGGGRAGKNPEYMKRHKMFGKEGWDTGRFGKPQKIPQGLKNKDLAGIPFRVAFALQADGWFLRIDNIWHKPSPMTESVKDRTTKAHEYVFLLTKSPHYYYDQQAIAEKRITKPHAPGCKPRDLDGFQPRIKADGTSCSQWSEESQKRVWGDDSGTNRRSVWKIAAENSGEHHFATMPKALARLCILAGSPREVCKKCGKPRTRIVESKRVATRPGKDTKVAGQESKTVGNRDPQRHVSEKKTVGWSDCGHNKYRPGLVLDPFGGTGTSAIVAAQLGRNYLMIEMSEKYCGIARKRLRAYQGRQG